MSGAVAAAVGDRQRSNRVSGGHERLEGRSLSRVDMEVERGYDI